MSDNILTLLYTKSPFHYVYLFIPPTLRFFSFSVRGLVRSRRRSPTSQLLSVAFSKIYFFSFVAQILNSLLLLEMFIDFRHLRNRPRFRFLNRQQDLPQFVCRFSASFSYVKSGSCPPIFLHSPFVHHLLSALRRRHRQSTLWPLLCPLTLQLTFRLRSPRFLLPCGPLRLLFALFIYTLFSFRVLFLLHSSQLLCGFLLFSASNHGKEC